MSIHRYATRQDGNHRAIVNALRAGGARAVTLFRGAR